MSRAGARAAAVGLPRSGSAAERLPLSDPVKAAWLATLPGAALGALAIALLGPPLGRLIAPAHPPFTFLTTYTIGIHPEPTEHARFLLALVAALLVALAPIAVVRRAPRLPLGVSAIGVPAAQALLVAALAAAWIGQRGIVYGPKYTREAGVFIHWRYFTPATLVAAAALAAGAVLAIRDAGARRVLARALSETRERRVAAAAVAVVATAAWLLTAVNSDDSIANAVLAVRYHLGFTLDETFAVLNGRTPLVDFTAQYGSLWPYAVALPLLAFGKTLLAYTIAMCTISGVALLAAYDVLRRVARSAVAGLALYLPFLATSLFMLEGDAVDRSTFGSYFATFPLRYAGPYVLAWLVARRLDRDGRARTWPLFLVAGLVLLNNADYGVPALGATLAALLWTSVELRPRPLARLGGEVLAGLAGALALVSLLTLVRSGSLPQLGRLVEFARVFAVAGYSMMPIPRVFGLHLAIYLTYAAALATATVRALGGERDRLLTGMLAWASVFGLGSASYYVGRSHPEALVATFSAWALTLALLTIVVVRGLAAQPRPRPSIAALAVLFGMGVAACSLAQAPAPWSQLDRLRAPYEPTQLSPVARPLAPVDEAAARRFAASLADGSRFALRRGAPVALLLTTGHRVADDLGVADVSPYAGVESVITREQLERLLDALRDAGGNTLVMPARLDPVMWRALDQRGFELVTRNGLRRMALKRSIPGLAAVEWRDQQLMKWVDTRHLHPRALRP